MGLSASSAFNFAACGSMTEGAANEYDKFMKNYYSKFEGKGGWLGEALDRAKETHDTFMRSRMWEFGKIIKGDQGSFVGRYEIGYLGALRFQQAAEGYMRDIIGANPMVMGLFEEGRVSGYDSGLHKLNMGVGEDNYFYRKVMDGGMTLGNDQPSEGHKTFLSSRDNYTHYSMRERMDARRTWRATECYIRNGFDPTSPDGDKVLSLEEVEERRKLAEEQKNEEQ